MSLRKNRSARARLIQRVSILGIITAGLCVLVGSINRTPVDGSTDVIGAPEQAIWEDGELIPPLPGDPDLRMAAIEQARASTASRPARAPDVTYQAVRSGNVAEPQFSSGGAGDLSSGTRYIPTAADLANINLKIPDDFVLSPDVVRELSKGGVVDAAGLTPNASLAQSLITQWHGIDQTGLTPPDCDLAVSTEYVALVVNDEYAVYDKCGTQLWHESLADLTNDFGFIFDPKIFFDEWSHRWVIAFVVRKVATQEAWIRVVVSEDDTPPGIGGHWWYDFDWTFHSGDWGDYPDLGFGMSCVYITTNDFNWSSSFQGARITVLDKSQIYGGTGASVSEFFAPTNPGDGTPAFAIRASEMLAFSGTYFLVNSKQGGGSFLTLWEITGAPASPVLNGYNMPVGTYDDPPPLEQPNATYVDCGDARLLTAKYRGYRLWTAHGQRVTWGEPDDRSAIEVYIIDTSTRTVSQESGGYGATGLWAYSSRPAILITWRAARLAAAVF